ncbi:MAG: hypothetical protein CSA22_06000 [Deltaproteobacteria bacterium]|nr:MAG: hypothetical protein CSA22_06000 [Deltaproteobacteria bacterium]
MIWQRMSMRISKNNSCSPGNQDTDAVIKNGVQQIHVKPGLSLSLVDVNPMEPLNLDFETHHVPLEFSFHLSGHVTYSITHEQGKNNFKGQPGLNVVSAFPHARGTMEIRGVIGEHTNKGLMDKDPVRMLAVHIEPRFFRQYLTDHAQLQFPEFEAMIQSGEFSYYFNPSPMSASMSVVAGQLFWCPYRGLARQWFYESKTLELMVLQFSQLSDAFAQTATQKDILNGLEVEQIQTARNLLCKDLENPPSLFQLAKVVGLTHTKLNKGFKALYGTTVFGYLRQHRLEQSRLMLEAAQMSISEIAYATGFSSPSHFAKAFLAYFGVQPSSYLKEVLQRRMISLA